MDMVEEIAGLVENGWMIGLGGEGPAPRPVGRH
jgi:hypothetical protein